jgi:hypothetical protein
MEVQKAAYETCTVLHVGVVRQHTCQQMLVSAVACLAEQQHVKLTHKEPVLLTHELALLVALNQPMGVVFMPRFAAATAVIAADTQPLRQ